VRIDFCTFIQYPSQHVLLTFSTQVSPIVPFGMYRENSDRNTTTINHYSYIIQSLINQNFNPDISVGKLMFCIIELRRNKCRLTFSIQAPPCSSPSPHTKYSSWHTFRIWSFKPINIAAHDTRSPSLSSNIKLLHWDESVSATLHTQCALLAAMKLDILMVVTMEITLFCDVKPCSLVHWWQCFGRTCCHLLLQGLQGRRWR
jgi:hypothetical protein